MDFGRIFIPMYTYVHRDSLAECGLWCVHSLRCRRPMKDPGSVTRGRRVRQTGQPGAENKSFADTSPTTLDIPMFAPGVQGASLELLA